MRPKQVRSLTQRNPSLIDYDELRVEEVRTKLRGLSDEEIAKILSYEKGHEYRKALVESVGNMIDN